MRLKIILEHRVEEELLRGLRVAVDEQLHRSSGRLDSFLWRYSRLFLRLPLGGDLVEGPAIAVEHRGLAREVLPALHPDVDIGGAKLDSAAISRSIAQR
jgi:hypothetical protein